jgi:hypothetical protein
MLFRFFAYKKEDKVNQFKEIRPYRMVRASNGKLCPVPPGTWADDPNNPANIAVKPVASTASIDTRSSSHRKPPSSITRGSASQKTA